MTLGPEPVSPSIGEIWARHGGDTNVIFGIFFLALAFADFPLWQRAGIAGLAALVFGSLWLVNRPQKGPISGAGSFREAGTFTGYWCLAVLDWLGYLGIICFGTAVLVELV